MSKVAVALASLGGTMNFDDYNDLTNLIDDIVDGKEKVEVLYDDGLRAAALKRARQKADREERSKRPRFLGLRIF